MVGRVVERDLLAAAGLEAARGEPSAVVLHGEPGVGKTRLVTEAADAMAATHEVLWARFPRFSSQATAFLPVAQALSRWSTTASDAACAAVFADAGDLAAIMPDLGPSGPVDGGRLTSLLTTVIHRIGHVRPLVLVADDLQWADSSSLDLLAYLVAGFGPGQQLAILATYRDTELGEGHRFNEWIADMRRMPRVTVAAVGRLDRGDTADLVHVLTADTPTGRGGPDVDAIYERSLGNPYLAELLVADPATVGGSNLEEAMLASWHRLGKADRTLTQILAIGGRPVPIEVLVDLAGRSGLPPDATVRGVATAQAAGLVVRHGDTVWFRHPLLAEVIAGTLSPPAARALHADYIKALEEGTGLPAHVRSSLLALHHQEAGHFTAAFTWSLTASADAAAMHATAEESEHLQRACRLWDDADEEARVATGDRMDLLERACRAALRAGHRGAAQALAQDAIRTVDRTGDPLRAVRLMYTFRYLTDRQQTHQADLDHAVAVHELAAQCGPSEQLALALCYRSGAEMWCGVPGAETRADAAIAMADQIGSPLALAHAHLVRSQFHWSSPAGAQEAVTAWEVLRARGDLLDWAMDNVKVMNCLEGIGQDAVIDHGLRVLADLAAAGAPALGGVPGAILAHSLLRVGRWDEAKEVVRANMAHQQEPKFAAATRCTAAQLSAREGDLDAARNHLARAIELDSTLDPLGSFVSMARVEIRWSSGDLTGAVEAALADIPRVAPLDPDHADELALWCLRSIADLAESRRAPDRAPGVLPSLARLDLARTVIAAEPAASAGQDNLHLAMATLIAAERARCTAGTDQIQRWRAARDAASEASLAWESGWAGYQLGRALLVERGHRQEATESLRTAYAAMARLGAKPLAERIRSVGAQAHLPIDETATLASIDLVDRPSWEPPGITGREREVLAQIITGRTYAEIARDLFISRKTVSVHVSNLLRKTGTTNRIELAALVAAQPGPGSD
jgi:DNA-binding CsgD family transcriptional regulator